MAERRMFARTITGSDAFLDMPQSTQCLYFHLNMRADDDGFINSPKSIMREVGCKDDDLRLLIVKRFIIPFESGIVVIKHWRVHNYIQADRYHETKYLDEKAELIVNDNKSYSLVSKMDTDCIQDVSKMDTEARLELEIEIDKNSNTSASAAPCAVAETSPAVPAKAIAKPGASPLYHAIRQSFLSKTPTFANYAKEAQAIKRVEAFAGRYAPEDQVNAARMLIEKYYQLTESSDKFWHKQPFTPSGLSCLMDRVARELEISRPMTREEAEAAYQQANEIPF